jgi:hypothetical protein
MRVSRRWRRRSRRYVRGSQWPVGVADAVANAIYNAAGVRVRDHPITLDKLLARLPEVG